ncbi:hypothetical protein [Pseudidiomarina terrestris]|uniref:MSHA biogenesis protein MshK n=1 Tax=Pseudidiomarina terrestris TaxID=2820060 RepID=A0AAW7QXT8_9GAMM|nr:MULTISPECIES: hypothetical protein [unclassified Pseudidiomarina]MDN7124266.1 hypothetical protein [Pseudidiomarina sp. 1APP75-32.1]MDN7126267.1 hypothetical protein [Pseudidiomarina sp. 1APR75-33.1]MDN7129443.1 hypothetical protein [Pseudidiomarina sp. 1APR75-15]MDN7134292.1 hypothetical protein [Pseudidiomarina sp. 1ASP75-5]MDN7137020.1 hypothetical protein [Pseudidiomarina sp. 1ASP75-14]
MLRVNAWLLTSCFVVSAAAAQELNDPTQPPQNRAAAQQQAQLTDLRLNAIQQRPSGFTAYINGQRIVEGEHLPPYTITKITMNHVIVRDAANGSEFKLSLYTQNPLTTESASGSGGQN